MKKINGLLFLLLIIIAITGCGQSISEPIVEDSPEIPPITNNVPNSSLNDVQEGFDNSPRHNILGKYICSNDQYDDEFYIKKPNTVPFIVFKDDWKCILGINYAEGFSIVNGVFDKIEENQIYVELYLEGSLFIDNETGEEYIPTQYIFSIASDKEIIIDKDCYGVHAGDSFVKSKMQSTSLPDPVALTTDCFPRGKWTINQLIEEYGYPENIIAWSELYSGHRTVHINITYKYMDIIFRPFPISKFSFYSEGEGVSAFESEEYELDEIDKNLELDVFVINLFDAGLTFPHDIKIGQSTKSQILAAHPDDDYDTNKNAVSYLYGFCDENGALQKQNPIWYGNVSYEFNESDILQAVSITWY